MMWTLVAGLSILLQFASGFVSAGSTHSTATTPLSMGGYDATIGAAPSTPIQFFTLVSGLVHLANLHKLTLIASLAA